MRVCEAAGCHVSASLPKSIFAICRARSRATTDQAFLFSWPRRFLVPACPGLVSVCQFHLCRVTALADDACSGRLYMYHTLVLLSACLLSRSCPPAPTLASCRYTPPLSIHPILPLLARYAVTAMLRPYRRCTTRLYSSPRSISLHHQTQPHNSTILRYLDLVSPFIP